MASAVNKAAVAVETIRHRDRRANIPTEELRDFVAEDEGTPRTMLYPRDPSLDPQLVWKGKDEQDRADLAVPVVPVYIQEKIEPRAIIEDLRGKQGPKPGEQLDLFATFDGPDDFDAKIDFYRHEHPWSNRMILGDSLLVMTSLAEKEGLRGKVQTIYFDPPYGIKFNSNWQVSTRERDVTDGKAEHATRQPEQIRAFRDTWRDGIHSYLAYLRDRLVTARELLTETGSVFVQIGDENVHLVRCVMDEVFGADNFVSLITFSKTTGATVVMLPGTSDYIVWYAKKKESAKYRRLFSTKAIGGEGSEKYDQVETRGGSRRSMTPVERRRGEIEEDGRAYRLDNLMSQSMGREKGEGAASWFPVRVGNREFRPNMRSRWKTNESGMERLVAAGRVQITGDTIAYVRFIDDFPAYPITNIWTDIGGIQSRSDPKVYVVQTATTAVERCLLMTTDPGDLVLDPTCGSGTTAYVAEQWGRRWITVDTSRVALALARTRLMAAKFPYYLLADSAEGIAKERELTGQQPPEYKTEGDIRKGFVYKRVPHVTLKSIANNPDIREGMTREEIDRAIARHAETETLYDQPYEDRKRLRVSGPFTVESLSPHRVLSTADDDQDGTVTAVEVGRQVDFTTMILDNLRKAGVQNTKKGERLTFDRLDPFAGAWLQASGEYTDGEGQVRRVAVSIGPEHGTVGPGQVKEAAKEAVQGLGFDLLIVCGFAFDPHVDLEAKRYGRLDVLPVKMNPDLAMGDDLLKKTGAGNLFMIFGEPDIAIRRVGDEVEVEIKGVDVYDPTTGELRPSSTDDIACWFIDTNYDEESFFVRHAYFTGADQPYDKLKAALRAEIDEAAWATLYRTTSRPFPAPATGKIAVKAINHYGDEVLKVYGV
jgi:adenine-specific DNA-methyltransferase